MFAIDPKDTLGLNDAQLDIIQRAIALEPMPVDERIADRTYEATATNEAGRVRLRNFTDPKISRLTAYRFHRENMLNEHLFHIWPAEGFDFPALTTVIFEMPQVLILGADLLPIADVVFDRTYYGRWMLGYAEVLKKHWPALAEHRAGPEPAPDPYFTNQIGSTMSVLMYLKHSGLEPAQAFLLELTEHWTTLHAQAQPRTDADAAAVEARRVQLMTKAYKALDYHSPASDGLASVLGWTGANLMFDHVFGPDLEDQGLDHKRTYLEVEVSPGTFSAPRSH